MKPDKILFFIVLALSQTGWAFPVRGQSPDALMEKANQAYIEEDYGRAIALYEQIRKTDREAATLYYNLGNAYFREGQLGRAIANYERALRLNRSDEAIQHNLQVARQAITEQVDPLPRLFFLDWHDSFVYWLTGDGWARVVVGSVCLGVLFFAVFLASGNRYRKRVYFMASVFMLFVAIISWYAARRQHRQVFETNRAVITDSTVTLRSAPGEGATALFAIYEGNTVVIKNTLDGWHEIRLPNGSVGWVRSEALETI